MIAPKNRLAVTCLLGVLAGGSGAMLYAAGSSTSQQAQQGESAWIDEKIPEDEREVLLSTVGYQIPEFTDEVEWLGSEQPTFASLAGKVVVLHSWNSKTTDGRAMIRRVHSLLRKYRDDVEQIALHTPEEADELIKKYARHSGKMIAPSAVDTEGVFMDELGMYKEPRLIVIDKQGRIRHAGISLGNLREAVEETMSVEITPAVVADALPPREDRVDEDRAEAVPAPTTEWPAHNRLQAGNQNNLQGEKGPALRVQKYLKGGEPDIENKVVLMEFWATWCGPCVRGIPHLNELQAAFPDDLVVVGISSEDEKTVRNAMQPNGRLDFEYTVAVDPNRNIQRVVGNRGIPHCIVLSSDGIVRWQGHPASLTEATVRQIVDANNELTGESSSGPGRWVTD